MDTFGTSIIQGEIQVLGPIHGGSAINTLVYLYATPDEWEMKQFVSQIQLEQYAAANMLAIMRKEN